MIPPYFFSQTKLGPFSPPAKEPQNIQQCGFWRRRAQASGSPVTWIVIHCLHMCEFAAQVSSEKAPFPSLQGTVAGQVADMRRLAALPYGVLLDRFTVVEPPYGGREHAKRYVSHALYMSQSQEDSTVNRKNGDAGRAGRIAVVAQVIVFQGFESRAFVLLSGASALTGQLGLAGLSSLWL